MLPTTTPAALPANDVTSARVRRPTGKSVVAFRNTLPNGVVVVTTRLPRWMYGATVFETAIQANGRTSDGVKSATRGEASCVHDSVCDGVYGRGYRAVEVVGLLLDLASGEVVS